MNKAYLNFRTDMADERVDTYKKVHNLSEIDGIKVTEEENGKLKITTVDVLNENGSKSVSKDIGKYITVKVEDIKYLEESDKQITIEGISKKIKELIENEEQNLEKDQDGPRGGSVMIVGLGNIYVTPDALGPKVVKYVDISRHFIKFTENLIEPNAREISAIAPGVLGTTGIETSEIIFSIVEKIRPNYIIAIDSLASGSVERLGNTIQLSNTGITPGAGVKNKREGLNKSTLNIPVIAIGVPTVVDMATITNEAIDKLIDSTEKSNSEFYNTNESFKNNEKNLNSNERFSEISLLKKEGRYNMIANVLDTENYIVTPKEIDEIVDIVAEIIASSLNVALKR